MHNCRCKRKINLLAKVIQGKGLFRARAGLDSLTQSGLARSFLQYAKHPSLYIDTYDSPTRTGHLRKRKTEETHGASNIEYFHPFSDVWGQQPPGVLEQLPDRAGKQVTYPEWTNVFRHCNLPISIVATRAERHPSGAPFGVVCMELFDSLYFLMNPYLAKRRSSSWMRPIPGA